jgi:hypothetical protein
MALFWWIAVCFRCVLRLCSFKKAEFLSLRITYYGIYMWDYRLSWMYLKSLLVKIKSHLVGRGIK